jgi:hypothetical protein
LINRKFDQALTVPSDQRKLRLEKPPLFAALKLKGALAGSSLSETPARCTDFWIARSSKTLNTRALKRAAHHD